MNPDGTRPAHTREWSCRARTKPSISCSAAAFLPGSAKYVECDVTLSKQTTAPFLPGATTAPRELRQGTAFYPELRRAAVPSLVCPDEERPSQSHYSFRARLADCWRAALPGFRVNPTGIHPEHICEGRAFARTLDPGVTNVNFGPFPTGFLGAFFATNSVCPRPFLTGSAPQTESSVTGIIYFTPQV